MADIWPATLPQYMLREGYSEGLGDGRLRSQPDTGPAKVRRRSSAMPRVMQGRVIMTAAQLATMRDFVEGTLMNGALPFLFPDPVTRYPSLVRFAGGLPVWNTRGIDYDVSLDLEVFYTMKPTAFIQDGQLLVGSISRNSVATYFDADKVMKTAAVNVLRRDYDPVSGDLRGALFEGAATNLLTYSEQMELAYTDPAITVTPNADTAPDGNSTADLLASNATTGNKALIISHTGNSSTQYVVSAYVKAAGQTICTFGLRNGSQGIGIQTVFDLASGAVSSNPNYGSPSSTLQPTIAAVGGGWYRISVGGVLNAAGGTETVRFYLNFSSTAAVGTGLYVWGAQMEAGPIATSYIKTTAVAAPRAADVASALTSAFQFNATEGALVAKFRTAGGLPDTQQFLTQIDDGTGNNRLSVFRNTTGKIQAQAFSGGVLVANMVTSTTLADNTEHRMVFTFKANSFSVLVSGQPIVTDNDGEMPVGLTTWRVGGWHAGGRDWNGHILDATYHPRWLSDAEALELIA